MSKNVFIQIKRLSDILDWDFKLLLPTFQNDKYMFLKRDWLVMPVYVPNRLLMKKIK